MVLAHSNPVHFSRLANALMSEGDPVLAHIDARVDQRQFVCDGVEFVDRRIPVYWGGWSMVAATLRLLEDALVRFPGCDYYWLLSGDSYPSRSVSAIHGYLETADGDDFLNYVRMPSVEMEKPLTRLSRHYIEYDPRSSRSGLAYRVIRRVMVRPYQHRLDGLELYCGSQWFTLSLPTVESVLGLVESYPNFLKLCQSSFIPDEFYFHTLIVNSNNRRIRPALFWADFRSLAGPRPPVIGPYQLEFLTEMSLTVRDGYGRHDVLMLRKLSDDSVDAVNYIEQEFW